MADLIGTIVYAGMDGATHGTNHPTSGTYDSDVLKRYRELNERYLQVMYESGVERGLSQNMEIDVFGMEGRLLDTPFEKGGIHETAGVRACWCAFCDRSVTRRMSRFSAGAKAAVQVAGVGNLDVDGVEQDWAWLVVTASPAAEFRTVPFSTPRRCLRRCAVWPPASGAGKNAGCGCWPA